MYLLWAISGQMIKNIAKEGLRSIVQSYDFYFIDLWGVIHNGIKLHNKAIEALSKISEAKKSYILLTNAPRPNLNVQTFLKKMNMDKNMVEKVYTSGQAALSYLKKNHLTDNFFHIGPTRDYDLFIDFNNLRTDDINKCDYFLCTGLYDQQSKDLNYYEKLLINFVTKKMICTNPDLVVDRGENREYCAGSVAKIFESLGGKVIYFGKPYAEIYKQAVKKNSKNILAIGDNLNTDIKGASNMNYDSLLITSGIHKKEIAENGIEKVLKKYDAKVTFLQNELEW